MNKTNCKIGEMFRNIDNLFNKFVKLIGDEKAFDDHWTGILTVKYIDDHNTMLTQKMIPKNHPKFGKYSVLSKEKAERLYRFLSAGHLTSYESRNPKAEVAISGRIEFWGHWGGAILISKQLIFSFSGLPELLDEAFVCFIGIKSGLMSKHQFAKIKKRRTDNPYIDLIHQSLIQK
jgi:hypothetical protein